MFKDRKEFYEQIEKERNTKIIAYVTGDRRGMETQIGADVPDIILEHLDAIKKSKKISLIMYTCGGDTLAAWNIVNLIREFCDELEIITPNKCRSAGTLMALGANNIIMTKQATLGPIDPSIIREMSPIIPNTNPPQKLSISVESVKGYIKLLKEEFGVVDEKSLSEAYLKLVDKIHPVVLGDVYRIQKQIKMLAKSLLKKVNYDDAIIEKIVPFLCSESGSHNYTINRTEAKELGLKIENPTQELYLDIKKWYNDICDELKLKDMYNPLKELAESDKKHCIFYRGLIESVGYGQDVFMSEVDLSKEINPTSRTISVLSNNTFEGWKHIC